MTPAVGGPVGCSSWALPVGLAPPLCSMSFKLGGSASYFSWGGVVGGGAPFPAPVPYPCCYLAVLISALRGFWADPLSVGSGVWWARRQCAGGGLTLVQRYRL